MLTPGLLHQLSVFLPFIAALIPWISLVYYRPWARLRGHEPLSLSGVAPFVMMAALILPIMLNAYAREVLFVSPWQRIGWLLVIGVEIAAIIYAQKAADEQNFNPELPT